MKNVVLAVLVLVAMIMVAVGLVGCNGEHDPLHQSSHIDGDWKGSFDQYNRDHNLDYYSMTLTLDRDDDDRITGTAEWSKYSNKTFEVNGTVRYGRIEATLKCKDIDEFHLSGSIDNHESSGTWESKSNDSYHGKFLLKKQN